VSIYSTTLSEYFLGAKGAILGQAPSTETIQLTEAGLGAIYQGTNPDLSGQWTPVRDTSLNEDYQTIGDAVDSIGAITGEEQENDLSKNFEVFQTSLDGDGNGSISRQDLEGYLGSL
jgi:hypothetical protein